MKIKTLFAALVVILVTGCANIATLVSCGLDPAIEPKPSAQTGRFELTLKYQVHGETRETSDVITCNYTGRACDGRGLHNDWSKTLKSGNKEIIIKRFSQDEFIYYPSGSCQNLMAGDIPEELSRARIKRKTGNFDSWGPVATDILDSKYGLILLSADYTKTP